MRYSRRKGLDPTPFHAKSKQSLVNFFHEYGIAMPAYRADKWRMVNPEVDQVKGQPHLGEVLIRATDGVHALVEDYKRKGLIQIHLTNFLGKVRPQGYLPKISMVAKPTKSTTVERRTKKTTKNKKPKTKSEFSKMFDEMFK